MGQKLESKNNGKHVSSQQMGLSALLMWIAVKPLSLFLKHNLQSIISNAFKKPYDVDKTVHFKNLYLCSTNNEPT